MVIKTVELETVCGITSKLPENEKPEIAFAGKSNVGKSSLINGLMNRKSLARTSAQPGKTQTINYYNINQQMYFVDLPGYGYAKVSKQERDRWGRLIEAWFSDSERMALGILIVDARHKPTADDCTMAEVFLCSKKPFLVVANKLDKLKKSEVEGNLMQIREVLGLSEDIPIIPFSAEKGTGRAELIGKILTCLEGKA